MREKTLFRLVAIILMLAGSFVTGLATPQGFTLSGKILATTRNAQFTVKLYPPLNSGRSVLLTTSTTTGEFQFTNVRESSYLMEVFMGKRLVHQEVIELKGDQTVTIDLRQVVSVKAMSSFSEYASSQCPGVNGCLKV